MQDILSQAVTFVLAGGRGTRLALLTSDRAKPAVPFGDGRIIDFALANCLRSDLAHPFEITQYQATHLTRHVMFIKFSNFWFLVLVCNLAASVSTKPAMLVQEVYARD